MQETGDIALEVERTIERLDQVRREIGRVIFGQERVVDETLITILAGGHALLVGVPGLAKTRLVQTLGTVLGLVDKRVQFTPDLMPADILGSEVLDETPGGQRSAASGPAGPSRSASTATAAGTTGARPSVGRRSSNCSRACCAGRTTAATGW